MVVEKKDIESVNIHKMERSDSFLQITKKRGQVLKNALKQLADESTDEMIHFSENFWFHIMIFELRKEHLQKIL